MAEHIYTPDQLIELQKCAADPIYFINNYVYCLHPTKGIMLMKLYKFQKHMINAMHNNKNVILKLSRQMGKTACMAAFSAWLSLFNDDKTILIVGNKQSAATELMDRIKLIYDYLPNWMRPAILINNRGEVKFDNNSRIVARATGINSGRGLSISFLICDELAFVPDQMQELFWSAVYPTVSTGGKVVIASTPNGDTNLFYRLWADAESGKNTFKPIKYKYDVHPDRNEAWKNETIANVGIKKFMQEFELEFISNDNTLVDSLKLATLKAEPAMLSINKFKIWEKFRYGQEYLVGVDISEGLGLDYCSIEIYSYPQLIQVAELYDNTIKPTQLYSALVWIMRQIEQAGGTSTWSFENNSIGYTIGALYESDENFPDVYLISQNDTKYGFNTNISDKNKAITLLDNLISKDRLKIKSATTIRELKNYIKYKNSYKAKNGYTDDCVSATLIIMRILCDMIEQDDQLLKEIYGDAFTSWENNVQKIQNEVEENINKTIEKNKLFDELEENSKENQFVGNVFL